MRTTHPAQPTLGPTPELIQPPADAPGGIASVCAEAAWPPSAVQASPLHSREARRRRQRARGDGGGAHDLERRRLLDSLRHHPKATEVACREIMQLWGGAAGEHFARARSFVHGRLTCNLRTADLSNQLDIELPDDGNMVPFFLKLIQRGQLSDALNLIDYEVGQGAMSPDCLKLRAAVLAAQGRWTSAQAEMVAAGADSGQGWCDVGAFLVDCAPAAAEQCLRRAAEFSPHPEQVPTRLACCLMAQRRPQQALTALHEAQGRQVIDAEGLKIMGDLQVDAGHLAAADVAYAAALRAGFALSSMLAGLAVAAAGNGRHVQAQALLDRLLAQQEITPRALEHALVAIALLGDRAALKTCWRHIDALGEAPVELHVAVVEALRFHDHLDEAHHHACRLTEALPRHVGCWRLRAEVCAAAGRSAEAAMAWREVAGLRPDDFAAHLAHGWALLALPPGAGAAQEAFARALDLGAPGCEALDGQQLAIAAEGCEARSAAWLHRLALRHPRNAELAESFIAAALREQVLLGEAYAALPALLVAAGDAALVRLVRRLTRASPEAAAALLGWLRGELAPPPGQAGRDRPPNLPLGAALLARLAKEAARQQARAQARLRSVPLPGLDVDCDAPAAPRLSLVWSGRTYEGPSPGCNHQGRAVILTDTGGVAWLPWGTHAAAEVGSAVDRLRVGGAWRLSRDQDARLAAQLAEARVGSLTAGDFLAHFGRPRRGLPGRRQPARPAGSHRPAAPRPAGQTWISPPA